MAKSDLPTYVDGLASPPLATTLRRHTSRSRVRLLVVFVSGLSIFALVLLVSSGHIPAPDANSKPWHRWTGCASSPAPPSPTDGRGTGMFKMLHLIDQETSELLMDRWFLHSHRGFSTSNSSLAELWGPGFPGWEGSLSLAQNVRLRYGTADFFDAALVYFNNDQSVHRGVDPTAWFAEVAEFSRQGRGTIIVDRPHEMRDQRRVAMYKQANVTLILAPYPSELFEYRQFEDQALLAHQPHFVDERVFFHPVSRPRSRPVVIAGDLGAFYPLRRRLADLILAGRIPGWIRGHPGYADIQQADQRPIGIDGKSQEAQLVAFGNDLGDSKICLVTPSRWGYSVQKYTEAALAGCLILGPVPLDRSRLFSSHIVPLSHSSSDDEIVRTVGYWLSEENDRERKVKARGMQLWAMREFGVDKYVEQVMALVEERKRGRKGMRLPWQWELASSAVAEDG